MSGHSPRGQAPGAPRAPPPTRSAGSSPGSWGWGGGRSGRHRRVASVWRGPVAPHASLRPFPLRRLSGNGRWTWLTGGWRMAWPHGTRLPARCGWGSSSLWGSRAARPAGVPQGSVGRGSTGWVAAQPWGAGPLGHCPGERSWGAGRGTRDPEEGCRGPGRVACLAWPLPSSAGDPTSSRRLGFLRRGLPRLAGAPQPRGCSRCSLGALGCRPWVALAARCRRPP